jgi:hypothetical protein
VAYSLLSFQRNPLSVQNLSSDLFSPPWVTSQVFDLHSKAVIWVTKSRTFYLSLAFLFTIVYPTKSWVIVWRKIYIYSCSPSVRRSCGIENSSCPAFPAFVLVVLLSDFVSVCSPACSLLQFSVTFIPKCLHVFPARLYAPMCHVIYLYQLTLHLCASSVCYSRVHQVVVSPRATFHCLEGTMISLRVTSSCFRIAFRPCK